MEEEDFNNWLNRIDRDINNYIENRGWTNYIPESDCLLFSSLCKHLMYVVTRFLEDAEGRELFVKIPVEEFADISREDLRIGRWRDISTTIISCLSLATADSLYSNTRETPNDGDSLLYISGRGNGVRKCQLNNGIAYNDNGARDNNYQYGYFFTKCKRNFVVNRRNAENLFVRLTQIGGMIENLRTGRQRFGQQYSSAALVSYETIRPSADITPWDDDWLLSPVRFASNVGDVIGHGNNYDIIVVLGDRKYMNNGMPIIQRYRNTRAGKIIYIGTTDVDVQDSYVFSIKELFHYCYDGELSRPTTIALPFEWLNQKKMELDQLLNNCSETDGTLTEDVQRKVSKRFLTLLRNADFSAEKLNEIKDYWDWENICDVFEDPDTCRSTIQAVSDWFQNLQFDGINPKREYMNNHEESVSFSKYQSIRDFIRHDVRDNRSIILDNLGFNERYDNRYSYILRYNILMRVTALYYEGFEEYSQNSLNSFLNHGIWYMSTPFRESGITCIDRRLLQDINHTTETAQSRTLDDFLNFENNDDNHPMYARNNTRYTVTFADRTTETIDGDIVIQEGDEYSIINIADLATREYRNMQITYYRNPDNFDQLIELGVDLPNEDINRYSNLWKERFITHFNTFVNPDDAVNYIHQHSGLPKNRIIGYSEENGNLFIRENDLMRRMCNYLVQQNLITQEDSDYILAARRAWGTRRDFGRNLKSHILRFFVNENYDSDLLRRLLDNGYTRENLIEQITATNTIRRITNQ